MNASRMQRFISPAFSGSGTDTFSVRMGRVITARVASTGPRGLLQVLALQDPPVLVRTPRGHVPDGHVGAVGGMPVLVGSTALEEGLADLQGGGIVQVELVLEMAQERNVVVLGGA